MITGRPASVGSAGSAPGGGSVAAREDDGAGGASPSDADESDEALSETDSDLLASLRILDGDEGVVPKVEEHAAGVEGIAPGALTLAGARELMGSNGMLAHEALASWSARDYIMFEKWTRGGTEVPSFSR